MSLWTKLIDLSLFKGNTPDAGRSVAVKQGAECLNRNGFMAIDIFSGLTEQLQADFELPAEIHGKSNFTLVLTCFNNFLQHGNK